MNISLRNNGREHIDFATLLAQMRFSPISIEEMDSIKLMNRIDTKFVTDETVLAQILSDAAAQGYRVFTTGGRGISDYDTLYYDTADLRMFTMHHNRRLVRQKVRTRVYEGAQAAWLEIKRKNNKGRTKKKRVSIALPLWADFTTDDSACRFLADHSDYTGQVLTPELETAFKRITLVNAEKTERLTIDTRLVFRNLRTGVEKTLGTAVIIELKQDGHADSEMKHILLAHRVKAMRVSKYCIGVTLTHATARSNRFKKKVRKISKIINQ